MNLASPGREADATRTPARRLGALALALSLPLLLWLATWAGASALVRAGDHDRSLAWVTGSEAQLARLEAAVAGHAVFAGGAVHRRGVERWRPAACPGNAVAVGFGRLQAHELAPSHDALHEAIARSGATRCAVHTFVQADLPGPFAPRGWPGTMPALVLLVVVPAGLVLVAHLALRGQGLVDGHWGWPAHVRRATLAATAALALLQAAAWATNGPPPPAFPGGLAPAPGPLLLVLVHAALLEEASLRAWWQPLAARSIGAAGAALLSATASMALRAPTDWPGAVAAFASGGVLALLYLRTRSLPACVLANAGGAALLVGLQAWMA